MPTLNFTETKSIAHLAYDGAAGESYRFADGATWHISKTWHSHITGFKAISIQGSGKSVLSFAGTDSLLDVAVDIQQVLGGTPPQYPQALGVTAEEKAANPSLILCGHSLGGGLAAYCSVITRLRAYTVNPAPLVGAANLRTLFGNNDQIINYIAGGSEFVSSSMGRNPGIDISVQATGNFFTRHSVGNVVPSVSLPTRI